MNNSIQIKTLFKKFNICQFLITHFPEVTTLEDFPPKIIPLFFLFSELPLNDLQKHVVVKFFGSDEDDINTRSAIICRRYNPRIIL
jgi:hypothetical protein